MGIGGSSSPGTEFAQVVQIPGGPSPLSDVDSAEYRITRFWLLDDKKTIRVHLNVLSPRQLERHGPGGCDPWVVEFPAGDYALDIICARGRTLVGRLPAHALSGAGVPDKSSEHAVFHGLDVKSQLIADISTPLPKEAQEKIQVLVYGLLERAIAGAKLQALASDDK